MTADKPTVDEPTTDPTNATPPDAPDEVEVRDNPGRRRFDILVDGEQAGFSMYAQPAENPDDQRVFYHTVIDDAFGGRGLAGILTRTALLTSVAEGHRIVAVCPYVAHWLRSHDDVEESVDKVRPVHLETVRRANAEADAADS
ncbi:GNAT family N-acetyltransferase [Brachybacterium tyrofermentans]|uniref:GNAT family N-acetyltransferase n=1 Tax=Brachybacterium tyrofermentans TaxID=47848 RepID=UPI003FD61FB9